MARLFLEPSNPTHRQYEALRAFFVDELPGKEAAKQFGYSEGSFRVLVHQFRQNPSRDFSLPPAKGPAPGAVHTTGQNIFSEYSCSCPLITEGNKHQPVSRRTPESEKE